MRATGYETNISIVVLLLSIWSGDVICQTGTTECCTPNLCEWLIQDRELLPSATKDGPEYSNKTLEWCLNECQKTTAFTCHSLDYNKITGTCRLSSSLELTQTTRSSDTHQFYLIQESTCRIVSACEGLVALDNSVHSTSQQTFPNYDIINLECEYCYEYLRGDDYVTCYYNSTVMGEPLVCQPASCSVTSLIPNSHLQFSEQTISCGGVITASCVQGYYAPTPSSDLICGERGTLSGDLPNCSIITCPPPQTNASSNNTAGTWGSVIEFYCTNGNYLYNNDTLICSGDNQFGGWISTATNTVSGSLPYCGPAPQCSQIATNATFTASESTFMAGTTIRFSCPYNQVLNITNSSKSKVICESTGSDTVGWSGTIPHCTMRPVCSVPQTNTTTAYNGSVGAAGELFAGSTVHFSCNSDSRLVGEGSLRCEYDDMSRVLSWSGDIPYCELMTCDLLYLTDKLTVVGGEMIYLLGESAEFICEYGYTLQTNSTLVCLSNSTWSDNIPQCELITCNTSLADDIHVILPNISLPSVGSIGDVVCSDNRTLSADMRVSCQMNGEWNISTSDLLKSCISEAVLPLANILESDNKWWILVGILGSMFLAALIAFLCCYFDCCGWFGGGLRRNKEDPGKRIVKYSETATKPHHTSCLCAKCVGSKHIWGCTCKACRSYNSLTKHNMWLCAHCNVSFLHKSKDLLCNCKTCNTSSQHSLSCGCMCRWCQQSREHYLQTVCDCTTCKQGESHRRDMTRCNCAQCREFRSHSGFKLLQHTQACTACQISVLHALEWTCDCEVCCKAVSHRQQNTCSCRSCAESLQHHQRLMCACHTCTVKYPSLKRIQFTPNCICPMCERMDSAQHTCNS